MVAKSRLPPLHRPTALRGSHWPRCFPKGGAARRRLGAPFQRRDEDAFGEIVTRHRQKMFSIALSHLGNHADAEEIAQDTFIRAYRGLASFRGDSSLATWLYRIAFNLSRNRYAISSAATATRPTRLTAPPARRESELGGPRRQ